MKKFILGLLVGLLLSSSIAYAADTLIVKPNAFPVLINGTRTAVEGYNVNGYTFLKLKEFEKAGLGVNFNTTTKQIEVTNSALPANTANNISITPDGITTIYNWEGKQYIACLYISNKLKEKGYDLKYVIDQNTGATKFQVTHGEDVLLDNVPTSLIYAHSSVEINYYINTILPLIK